MSNTSTTPTTLTYELFLGATPAEVWRAIVDPAMTERYFFGTRVSPIERGAPFHYLLPDGNLAVDGEVLAVDPQRRLETTWTFRYDPELAEEKSRVIWTIEPRGAATKLTAMHDCSQAPKTAAHVMQDGWTVVLSGLKTLVETGQPLVIGQ